MFDHFIFDGNTEPSVQDLHGRRQPRYFSGHGGMKGHKQLLFMSDGDAMEFDEILANIMGNNPSPKPLPLPSRNVATVWGHLTNVV